MKDEFLRKAKHRPVHLIERVKFVEKAGDITFTLIYEGDRLSSQEERWAQQMVKIQQRMIALQEQSIPAIGEADAHMSLESAQLCGANLHRQILRGVRFLGADLDAANLEGCQLQGAQLQHSQLRWAFVEDAGLQSAHLHAAQLQHAWLYGVQLHKANLAEAQLQSANLDHAQLQEASLLRAKLQAANLFEANLSDVNFDEAVITTATLKDCKWHKPPIHVDKANCQPLALPRCQRKAAQRQQQFILKILLKRMIHGEDEDDDGEDEDEDSQDEDEDAQEEVQDNPMLDCVTPLLCCQRWQSAVNDVQDTAVEALEIKVGEVADRSEQKLQELASQGAKKLGKLVQDLDSVAKAKAKALLSVLEHLESDRGRALRSQPKVQAALQDALKQLARTRKGQRFQNDFDNLDKQLKQIRDQGAGRMLRRLADSKFACLTGYTAATCLACLKVSPREMAKHQKELNILATYIGKLQETVNKNNWDDVIDNFLCLYELRDTLSGERAQQVFQALWTDHQLRRCVAVGLVFREMQDPSNPPPGLIHCIKKAVKLVKDNAVAWDIAISNEIACIDRMKAKQDNLFALMISAISGFFVFIATFFSGLALDALKEGRMVVPYVSSLVAEEA